MKIIFLFELLHIVQISATVIKDNVRNDIWNSAAWIYGIKDKHHIRTVNEEDRLISTQGGRTFGDIQLPVTEQVTQQLTNKVQHSVIGTQPISDVAQLNNHTEADHDGINQAPRAPIVIIRAQRAPNAINQVQRASYVTNQTQRALNVKTQAQRAPNVVNQAGRALQDQNQSQNVSYQLIFSGQKHGPSKQQRTLRTSLEQTKHQTLFNEPYPSSYVQLSTRRRRKARRDPDDEELYFPVNRGASCSAGTRWRLHCRKCYCSDDRHSYCTQSKCKSATKKKNLNRGLKKHHKRPVGNILGRASGARGVLIAPDDSEVDVENIINTYIQDTLSLADWLYRFGKWILDIARAEGNIIAENSGDYILGLAADTVKDVLDHSIPDVPGEDTLYPDMQNPPGGGVQDSDIGPQPQIIPTPLPIDGPGTLPTDGQVEDPPSTGPNDMQIPINENPMSEIGPNAPQDMDEGAVPEIGPNLPQGTEVPQAGRNMPSGMEIVPTSEGATSEIGPNMPNNMDMPNSEIGKSEAFPGRENVFVLVNKGLPCPPGTRWKVLCNDCYCDEYQQTYCTQTECRSAMTLNRPRRSAVVDDNSMEIDKIVDIYIRDAKVLTDWLYVFGKWILDIGKAEGKLLAERTADYILELAADTVKEVLDNSLTNGEMILDQPKTLQQPPEKGYVTRKSGCMPSHVWREGCSMCRCVHVGIGYCRNEYCTDSGFSGSSLNTNTYPPYDNNLNYLEKMATDYYEEYYEANEEGPRPFKARRNG